MEHKSQKNKLAEAIAETAVATMKSWMKSFQVPQSEDAEELLKSQSAGILAQLFLGESGSESYEQTMLKQHSLHMAEGQKTAQDKLNESL